MLTQTFVMYPTGIEILSESRRKWLFAVRREPAVFYDRKYRVESSKRNRHLQLREQSGLPIRGWHPWVITMCIDNNLKLKPGLQICLKGNSCLNSSNPSESSLKGATMISVYTPGCMCWLIPGQAERSKSRLKSASKFPRREFLFECV
jgi:hypothetical protein